MNLLTTRQVAERIGVSTKRVQAMIRDGRLPAQKLGRDYAIKDTDLRLVADRKPGRPPGKTGRKRRTRHERKPVDQ